MFCVSHGDWAVQPIDETRVVTTSAVCGPNRPIGWRTRTFGCRPHHCGVPRESVNDSSTRTPPNSPVQAQASSKLSPSASVAIAACTAEYGDLRDISQTTCFWGNRSGNLSAAMAGSGWENPDDPVHEWVSGGLLIAAGALGIGWGGRRTPRARRSSRGRLIRVANLIRSCRSAHRRAWAQRTPDATTQIYSCSLGCGGVTAFAALMLCNVKADAKIWKSGN